MDEPKTPKKSKGNTSGLAKCSLALGILGIFLLGIFAAAPAVICGHMALFRIRRLDNRLGGRRLAIAGLVIGYLGLALIPFKYFSLKALREDAREVSCQSKMRQIMMAFEMYTDENNGSLPTSLDQLEQYAGFANELTQEGIPEVFVCLSAENKSTASYEIVPQSETSLYRLTRDTVVIREKYPNHRGKFCVAYRDGEVEMVSK